MKAKLMFILAIILVSLSISSVCASDVDNQTIQSIDQITSTGDVIVEDVKVSNVNDIGSFGDLQSLIDNNDVVNLTKDFTAKESDCVHISGSKIINGNGHVLNGNGKTAIFKITGGDVVLNDIMLINGESSDGGAVYVSNANSLTFNNIAFKDNHAGYGGAVYIDKGKSFSFVNCYFEDNHAGYGGAVFIDKGKSFSFVNCYFLKNTAHNGGAIYAENNIEINGCEFMNNLAKNYGGAIYGEDNVDVVDSIFKLNSAYVDGGAIYSKYIVAVKKSIFDCNVASGDFLVQCCGGAISCANNVKVDNSTFINNHADYGGAIYADTVTWVESVSYFVGNYVEDNQGGAIYTNMFNTDVVYGIFIGNQAKDDDGGAIYINKKNHITFSHCTFINNYAADEGGAIYVDSSSSVLTLKDYNSFINNHADDEGQDVFNKGEYDEIKNNWWGTASPDFSEDLLVEWKAFLSNEMHEDSNPLKNPYDNYADNFIPSFTIQNSGVVQNGNQGKFNDAGAIYDNMMQNIKGSLLLNSNLMLICLVWLIY